MVRRSGFSGVGEYLESGEEGERDAVVLNLPGMVRNGMVRCGVFSQL